MMNFVEEIELFREAEHKIIEYSDIINVMRNHVRARIDLNKPMPQQASFIILHNDSGDKLSYLKKIFEFLAECENYNQQQLNNIRLDLANCNILYATLVVFKWARNMGISMEDYFDPRVDSAILPPPHMHFASIAKRIREYSQENKEEDFAHYLRTVKNPWAEYAAK